MGLFSSKKTIVVSSTVYNLAGEEANRPNFMKSTIFSAVMNKNDVFLGESLANAYLTGPGINQRQLFNYAVRTDFPGLPTYSISQSKIADPEIVRPYLFVPSSPPGLEALIQQAYISDGDYEVFAEQYMNANYPEEFDTDWVAEYNKDDHTITIQLEGGGTATFAAGDYDSRSRYVVADYYCIIPEDSGPLDEGTKVIGVTSGLPSTAGFTLQSTTNTGIVTYTQNQTRVITKTYSDGRPTVVDTDYPVTNTDFNTILTVHTKDDYEGGTGTDPETITVRTYRRVWQYRQVYTSSSFSTVVNDLGGGVFETVDTDITGDFLRTIYDYQIDTQELVKSRVVGGNRNFIYKLGTGNAVLDAMDEPLGSPVLAEYFPIVPIRLNNVSITDPTYEELYAKSKKLYKRATKREKLEKLVEKVEENEDLAEIDYAYVQWGISLNTEEQEARKYIFEFWDGIKDIHGLPSNYITTFLNDVEDYQDALDDLNNWVTAQSNPASYLYGTSRPDTPAITPPKTTTLRFVTDHPQLQDFDNRISFAFINKNTFFGLGKTGAKKDEYWYVIEDPIYWNVQSGINSSSSFGVSRGKTTQNKMSVVSYFWQHATNQYTRIRVWGGLHQNFIYGGKAVRIHADEALVDEDDSGFLIPLHAPTLKEAGLVSSTQLATANTYIVFNSYKIYKKKWYQTFLGMLFIIIAVVVVAALIAPQFVGQLSGVLGTNAGVGASLGLSGTSAIVAGAVANAIAATVISMAISEAAVAIFGEKLGRIIGAVLSFTVSFGMTNGFGNWGALLEPQNLLALSSALANGYSGYVQASIAEGQQDMFRIQEGYEKEMERIQKLMAELMGNDLAFNPMSLTDAGRGNGSRTGGYLPESLDDFIQRTTLTGSDIVDMSLSIITDFADLSLTLPRT